MSIERAQPLKPVSTIQTRENSDIASNKVRQAESDKSRDVATQVKLSAAQAQLMQPGSQDINQARVETLKTAIRNGELKMDSSKIADALIQETKDWLQSNRSR
nr:flagellar biosynthesis anti-sigma factor FlgM [Pantoea sp. 201603H]